MEKPNLNFLAILLSDPALRDAALTALSTRGDVSEAEVNDAISAILADEPVAKEANAIFVEIVTAIRAVEEMLRSGKIDKATLQTDPEGVREMIRRNERGVEKLPVTSVIYRESLELAKSSLASGQLFASLVMVATANEHLLNTFFRHVLDLGLGMSNTKIKDKLGTNIGYKLGDLMVEVTGRELDEALRDDVLWIAKTRNRIVHYKAPTWDFASTDPNPAEKLREAIVDFGLEKLLKVPADLNSSLNLMALDRLVGLQFAANLALRELKNDGRPKPSDESPQ